MDAAGPPDIAAPGTFRRAGPAGTAPTQRRAGLVAALLLVLAGLFTLKGFLPALAWAAVFGIALQPWRQRLARRWPGRPALVSALFVLGVLLLFVIPVALVTAPLVQDAQAATQWFAQAQGSGVPAPAALASLPFGDRITAWWARELGQPGGVSAMASHAIGGGLLATGRAIGAAAARRLVLFAFTLLALFFLLRDADAFVAELRVGSARAFGPAGEHVGRQIIRSVQGTVNGLVLVGLGEGVVLGIVYAACGTPHPTLFGLVTALLAMVPFGAPVAFLIAAAVALAGGSMMAALVIAAAGFVVTFVADHFIRPVLIGGATRLPFLWVLLGILGGVEAWGLVGLFVGPAVMAALVLLWREWIGAQAGPLNPPEEATAPPSA
jgi:predicted PurR-regulated permease PerM